MKGIRFVTFWIGVNIIGLPKNVTHIIEQRKTKHNRIEVFVKELKYML